MDRSEATRLLTGCENGTFLVRISKNLQRAGEYSLSVVYNHPRHIRIQRTSPSIESGVMYYLCRPQRFPSIAVSYHNSATTLFSVRVYKKRWWWWSLACGFPYTTVSY
ncbi:unnamed protein product [Dibothriocephalus latus]|uniref:SH2 domain-containing protein n=1 Tax=Dibothriocephalus latus TaxID=60516 RepID=A0A3P6QM60_DIBLA|nr:unnamed protein product [Dibothriocephalus latus]